MFVKTLKLKKSAAAAAAVLLAVIIVITAAVIAVKTSGRKKEYRVKTEQQRQVLIKELGWEVGEKPQLHKTITIPKEFDDVYEGYNTLQKEQGFDLSDYKGKKVEIYSYQVYNYKGHKDCMTLTLMGCDGLLIGGDLCCTELDGFMQGIMKDK